MSKNMIWEAYFPVANSRNKERLNFYLDQKNLNRKFELEKEELALDGKFRSFINMIPEQYLHRTTTKVENPFSYYTLNFLYNNKNVAFYVAVCKLKNVYSLNISERVKDSRSFTVIKRTRLDKPSKEFIKTFITLAQKYD